MEAKKYYLNAEVPESIYLWLKEKAEKERRSVTAQFIWELQQLKEKGE